MAARSGVHSYDNHRRGQNSNSHSGSTENDCSADSCTARSRAHSIGAVQSFELDDSLSVGFALPFLRAPASFSHPSVFARPLATAGSALPSGPSGTAIVPSGAAALPASSGHSYYLVIVTAENCPACSNFKQNTMERLVADLKAKNYGIEHIHLPSTSASIPSSYPTMLESLVIFFPSLILVQGKSWEAAKRRPNERFGARVFNTVRTSRGIEPRPKSSAQPTNVSSIKAWISSIVDQDVSLSMQL